MPITFPPDLMVSVSGFRGRVGDPLTPELVSRIAASFGAFLGDAGGPAEVLVGRDSRTSGPMFNRAVQAGLQSVGARVVDLGIVPTPTLMLAVKESTASGGIIVTASHNPAEWNALKFAAADGLFLDRERMAEFQRYLQEEDPPRATWDAIRPLEMDDGASQRHLRRILALPHVSPERIRSRKLRVALDCVHGAGGSTMLSLLEALGCEVKAIGLRPDGLFPRDPEPTAENLGELAALVRRTDADVGLAVDPDADRLSLVDETGSPVGEDYTLAVAASVVLRRTVGPVVTNLSTSQVVDDAAAEHGATVLRAPVGEINVARRMQEESAVVGGEGNGGVILPALHHTRDAPLAAALTLQFLADGGVPLSQALGRWPGYRIVKEKVSFPREALARAYHALEEVLGAPDRDTSDGLRLAWPADGTWLHVRPSGTEPVVRIIAEAPDEAQARSFVTRARECLAGVESG